MRLVDAACLAGCLATALVTSGCTRATRAAAGDAAATREMVPAATGPVAAGGRFAMHSGMWVNLHHFLYVVARARSGLDARRPAVASSLADTAGLGARSADERQAWEAAVEHYQAALAARDAVFDTLLIATKDRLAAAEGSASLRGSGVDPALAARLERAAPAYRAVWWARHDAANRAWIAAMLPLLARHGDAMAAGLERALEARWPAWPLRVDVAAYANWAGAYTTTRPAHVVVSSLAPDYRGSLGLEMLFHEASHAMDDSLVAALEPGTGYDVAHAIIFFTAGELTRRAVPGHTPYAEAVGLWRRSPMGAYLPAIRTHWTPRLDGRATLRDAARAVVTTR